MADLYHPRFEFRYLAREDGRLRDGPAVPGLPFSLLVTLEASDVPLYQMVRTQFQVLTPIQLSTHAFASDGRAETRCICSRGRAVLHRVTYADSHLGSAPWSWPTRVLRTDTRANVMATFPCVPRE